MLLTDLGLTTQSLRAHLAERARFFASRERLERLKKLVSPDDTATDLDRKLIAVLVEADHPEFFTLLITLLDGMPDGGSDRMRNDTPNRMLDGIPDGPLDLPPPLWPELAKYGVEATFWDLVETHFGWRDPTPTLKGLLIRLMVSDLANALGSALPAGLAHLVLTQRGMANAVVCLAQWRDSSARSPSYERLSAAVAGTIKLDQQLSGLGLEALQEAKTFLRVEQAIAGRLRDRVLDTAETIDAEAIRAVAAGRQDGYWAATTLADTEAAPRQALHAVYQALETAADLFALRSASAAV